jgi:type II secretory ATPase GspE/PulE/Tfp pilus assembly ATPase PilB-like protein
VEDPVEIQLPGICQVNINAKLNLDFSNILATFLRQDPDIIMVGEIRNLKTARMAIQAALTGHLVLATLHSNHALEAIVRLSNMGISNTDIEQTITLVIAQRLVRKLCLHCKIMNDSDSLPFSHYRAQGCDLCLEGYQGRTGIFEVMPLQDDLLNHINNDGKISTLMQHIKKQPYLYLKQIALENIKAGLTDINEIKRVLGNF